jgi:hypothetical protein
LAAGLATVVSRLFSPLSANLLQAGVPIYHVARPIGDTVATVERVYGHHADYPGETINTRAG